PFGAPRNGMPSLHTVWALLVWFNAGTLPASTRRLFRLFAVMNIWAAMGLDDTHWFMDVVVGVPIAVAIQSALLGGVVDGGPRRGRWAEWVGGAALGATWLAAFRVGEPLLSAPALVAWPAVIATICWPLARRRTARVGLASKTAKAVRECANWRLREVANSL